MVLRSPSARQCVPSQVRRTTDGRGNGAFATASIVKGAFIGEYQGDMLSEAQYWSRYPSGVVRHALPGLHPDAAAEVM